MTVRVAIPDMISPSYFPAIAAVELGYFSAEGLDASIELVFPVTDTFARLRDRELDYVVGAAHAPLYAFREWQGCKLLCAVSQGMYWFLIVRRDLDAKRGDLNALRGLRIGAAPGPVDGLREMLFSAGLDPDRDVSIGPVPGAAGAGVSFGVAAAQALEDGELDGFWANGMGAEVALRREVGSLLVDARRGDGPSGSEHYTFPALVTTDERIEQHADEVAATTRAITSAMRALAEDPSISARAAKTHFPKYETSLIAELVERDAPFYDPVITPGSIEALNDFSGRLGLLDNSQVPYDKVVAGRFQQEFS